MAARTLNDGTNVSVMKEMGKYYEGKHNLKKIHLTYSYISRKKLADKLVQQRWRLMQDAIS